MVTDDVEHVPMEDKSTSSASQISDDPALRDSKSGRSTAQSGTDASSASSDEANKFVKKETRNVVFLRTCVLLLLFAASAAISLVVFFITAAGEDTTFEGHYYASADKVTDIFLGIATNKMEAAGALIVAMTSEGLNNGRDWPFVTVPDFQERAEAMKEATRVLYVGFNPIVTQANRVAWENYTNNAHEAQWYGRARDYQKAEGTFDLDTRAQVRTENPELTFENGMANRIYDFKRDTTGKGVISPEDDFFLPIWQYSPITSRAMVNQNRKSNSQGAIDCITYGEVVFGALRSSNPGYGSDDNPYTAEIAWLLSMQAKNRTLYQGDPFSNVFLPVYNQFRQGGEIVAVMRVVLHWARFFRRILPKSVEGVIVVLENGCDEPYTYQINGAEVIPLGHGDLHDSKYDGYMRTSSFEDIDEIGDGRTSTKLHYDKCVYSVRVYPSDHMLDLYKSNTPILVTMSVAFVFGFAVLMFFVYDRLVEKRQRILMDKARRTHQIVASLFPKNIRDQILNDNGELHQGGILGAKNQLKSLAAGGMDENALFGQMPIADLYPESTVMFADISGFTSWSSSREPAQVFVLLQSVYGAFDIIAKKRKVFKVETIGDCYVACAGVPEADPAHAVKMARFAWDCMVQIREVTRELETQLGPGTGELTMRFGLNSGPVTAGLLRGDRSRFQLFGDTVNTAARMESTGRKGRIQCSQSTAEKLIQSGKDHWITPREDLVTAKGKGIMKTYWLTQRVDRAYSENGDSDDNPDGEAFLSFNYAGQLADDLLKHGREVEWVAEVLSDSIRDIVAQRESRKGQVSKSRPSNSRVLNGGPKKRIPLDEVVDVIEMPAFDTKQKELLESFTVRIPDKIARQIREYVSYIAQAYRKNPFHSFEHACHVLLCVSKFLKRLTSPELSDEDLSKMKDSKKVASHLHTYSHGINSDPMTIFSILFSALIHDTDHHGVSNTQLGTEQPYLADRYKKKSIAEQNSLDVAWDVLMDSHFRDLREYIFETEEDFGRFRQITVNLVLATDIFDPEYSELRKKRWNNAFSESAPDAHNGNSSQQPQVMNARATVVLEAIMQASDVCHTMQHWHIYQRFNKRLFEEILVAYRQGRCGANPVDFWYEGELKFFDNYVIPLAQKLKECKVFGVSSDECLSFAMRNRAEWENRGKFIVAEYIHEFAESNSTNNKLVEMKAVEKGAVSA